jgi:hydroxymethylpyrimidine/phosphomethylpyrimidine kinase
MVATSGDRLLDRDAERWIVERLVPLRPWSPNLHEAAILVGEEYTHHRAVEREKDSLETRIDALRRQKATMDSTAYSKALEDLLVMQGGATRSFAHPRLDTTSTHGTGCTLSAAITAGLAHGRPLEQAVGDAVDFVQRAIAAAPALGRGHGPLNHFVPGPPRPPVEGLWLPRPDHHPAITAVN